MFKDIKTKLKSATPSIRSVKSVQLPSNSVSTPVLPTTVDGSHSNSRRASSISVVSNLPESRSSYTSSPSTASSSSASLSMPPTPPTHIRYGSIASLPGNINHDHLKPGDNAELLSYNKTINMYRENAKHDPNLQCDLAMCLYESALQNEKDKKTLMMEAAKMLKTLALRGHATSQYYLANMYASGNLHKTGKSDFGNAFPLFVQAAKHQHVDAAYRAAKCYEDGLGCLKNKSKAVQYYRLAATLNHPGAMYRLGLANINGEIGLARNVRDGNKWLKRSSVSATREYPHALHELGLLHERGCGGIIFKDPAYSVQLYARAAELGYTPSAYRLGECYEYGFLKCPKDAALSVFYYTIAAKNGNAEACFALSAWYLSGDDGLKADEAKALYWAKLSSEKGLAKADFALGYFAELGIGRPKDQTEAMQWYKKAAEQGHEQAQKRLTKINLPPSASTLALPSVLMVGESR